MKNTRNKLDVDKLTYPGQDHGEDAGEESRDIESLGPSDSSDSGSDLQGLGDIAGGDENSDRFGTGERFTAGKERDIRLSNDTAPDGIVGPEDAGLGGGLDQAEEAILGVTDEELAALDDDEGAAERASDTYAKKAEARKPRR
jgi:hypothetical protein